MTNVWHLFFLLTAISLYIIPITDSEIFCVDIGKQLFRYQVFSFHTIPLKMFVFVRSQFGQRKNIMYVFRIFVKALLISNVILNRYKP